MTEILSIYSQLIIFLIIFQFPLNKIILNSFGYTENNYFKKKKVPIISCYKNLSDTDCKKNTDGEYKIQISKFNLINQEPDTNKK